MASLANSDQSTFLRRERWMIVIFGALAMCGSLGCIGLMSFIFALEEYPPVSATPEDIANATHVQGTRVRTTLSIDRSRARYFGDGRYHGWLVATSNPQIIAAFDEELLDDIESGEQEVTGTLYYVDYTGYTAWQIPPETMLLFSATELGRDTPEGLWLVEVERGFEVRNVLLLVLGALGFIQLLVMVGAFLNARYRSDVIVNMDENAVTERSPILVFVLMLVTLGLYSFYWDWVTTAELRRKTGRVDFRPGIDLLLQLATLGLWRWYVYFRNAEACDLLISKDDGRPASNRWAILGLGIAAHVISGFCVFAAWVILQLAYNKTRYTESHVENVADVFR